MSRYLNFYMAPFIRDGDREVRHKVLLLESDCAEFPEHPSIEPIATFETTTEPPTLVRSHQSFSPFWDKHPRFPEFHIDPFGNICRSKGHEIVMQADR